MSRQKSCACRSKLISQKDCDFCLSLRSGFNVYQKNKNEQSGRKHILSLDPECLAKVERVFLASLIPTIESQCCTSPAFLGKPCSLDSYLNRSNHIEQFKDVCLASFMRRANLLAQGNKTKQVIFKNGSLLAWKLSFLEFWDNEDFAELTTQL